MRSLAAVASWRSVGADIPTQQREPSSSGRDSGTQFVELVLRWQRPVSALFFLLGSHFADAQVAVEMDRGDLHSIRVQVALAGGIGHF